MHKMIIVAGIVVLILSMFILLPEVVDAKVTSSGDVIRNKEQSSSGGHNSSQQNRTNNPNRTVGSNTGRRRIPIPDRNPVREPEGTGGKKKGASRCKTRAGQKSRVCKTTKKSRKIRSAKKRVRKELKKIESSFISKHFKLLTDNRMEGKTKHKLIDIMVITICAAICGANGWTDVEVYGKAKYNWLKTFLELPNGIPSHDTFGRIFRMICPKELETCFLSWIESVCKLTKGQVVAIDGKTLRRSYDRSSGKGPIHMVSAWASKNGMTLGQVKTDDKSNEITAIPELLKVLELEGCIVTIDAMGCQRKIAELIIKKKGDYVLAVKGNQKNLYNDIKLFFEEATKFGFKDVIHDFHETVDRGHGRIEIRRYRTVSEIDWLIGKENWKGIRTIGMAECEQHENGKISTGIRYYISSLDNNAKQFGDAVRKHWGIENSVHWILDVAFREDECRIRKDNAPTNFAIIRHIARNLLKQEKTMKVGVKGKRLCAGWDNDYLSTILNI